MHKIIHIDMDAFFAAIEQRNNPELRGKPVAVGGESERGVVSTASYEARKFGVHSAMSSVVAKRLCPNLIFVHSNFDEYKKVSNQIKSILSEYTDLIEPLSIDEAFLDVTTNLKGIKSATLIAKEIRKQIFETTQLTASAGVSYNMFLAKLASDMNKPDGLKLILPDEAEKILEKLPVEKFYGIGKSTSERMHKFGIHTGLDLKKLSAFTLKRLFGKAGEFYYNICRGIDERKVTPYYERKSVGTERTFSKNITTQFERITELYHIAKELDERLKESNFAGKTLTLKIKFHNFDQISRSKTFDDYIVDFHSILTNAKEMLSNIKTERTSIRLMGLTVSNANTKPSNRQLTIDF
ncbi:MAG: DNA polymerase IV [Prevotellaceae bacterium]|jgi:DNA polymerase-4|nr:DNA polymerase IV [Prevotellaceae bacterium]